MEKEELDVQSSELSSSTSSTSLSSSKSTSTSSTLIHQRCILINMENMLKMGIMKSKVNGGVI